MEKFLAVVLGGIAVDSTSIYWVDNSAGTVVKLAK
jgi:hypothetical protein